MELLFLVGAIGALTGFMSGLLGIGGGIIMAPLLLFFPVLFNFPPLSMHTVAGLTIVQGLAACVSGGMSHKRSAYFSGRLAAWMGVTLFIASFIGGVLSRFAPGNLLLLIFAVMALVASYLMIFNLENETEAPDISAFDFSRSKAVIVAGMIGLLGGLVGQGGSFILIPLMVTFMRIPTRIAIGTNLAIVFLAVLAAFLGKAATHQVDWKLALPIAVTVIPFAFLGASVSRRISVDNLKIILALCILFAALRIGFAAFGY